LVIPILFLALNSLLSGNDGKLKFVVISIIGSLPIYLVTFKYFYYILQTNVSENPNFATSLEKSNIFTISLITSFILTTSGTYISSHFVKEEIMKGTIESKFTRTSSKLSPSAGYALILKSNYQIYTSFEVGASLHKNDIITIYYRDTLFGIRYIDKIEKQ